MRLPACSRAVRTPILCSLHWLAVQYRIEFKILLVVYKALKNLAPQNLSELFTEHNTGRSITSQTCHLLRVPRYRLRCRRDRVLVVADPKLWNELPLFNKTAPFINLITLKINSEHWSKSAVDLCIIFF